MMTHPAYLLIPDSFKGTMSSRQICEIMERSIRRLEPDASVISLPVADGGEGSIDAFLAAMGGARRHVRVCGPFMEELDAEYAVLPGETAVIEIAACAGLPLVSSHPDPERATTYGVGQLILHALHSGCRRVIVCLGGSATNDGGAGAAAALGVEFFDAHGRRFVPTGGTLGQIASLKMPAANPLAGVSLTAMCDVDNPLLGPDGASAVFGPQKGATPAMVQRLEDGLRHYSQLVTASLGCDAASLAGAGAAGGLGYGLNAFFGAEYRRGIDTILDLVKFEELLPQVDWILTGEGKIDAQTSRGKVVAGVARRAKARNVPVLAVVGDIEDGLQELYEQGVWGIFTINRRAVPFSQAQKRAPWDLECTVDNLVRFLSRIPPRA